MRKTMLRRAFRELERRIARIEELHSSPSFPGVVWAELLDSGHRHALTPGCRIVEDYFNDENGCLVMIRERITNDPSDLGMDYAHGTWDSSELPSNHGPAERISWRRARLRVDSGPQDSSLSEIQRDEARTDSTTEEKLVQDESFINNDLKDDSR